MLIKRKDSMRNRDRGVKKIGLYIMGTIALCSTTIAPSAFASNYFVDRTVTVKFKTSELQSESGTEKVYTKIKKKAKSFCRADSYSLYYRDETVQECADDLVEQFIDSANINTLTEFHLSQISVAESEQYASNKSQ